MTYTIKNHTTGNSWTGPDLSGALRLNNLQDAGGNRNCWNCMGCMNYEGVSHV